MPPVGCGKAPVGKVGSPPVGWTTTEDAGIEDVGMDEEAVGTEELANEVDGIMPVPVPTWQAV